MVTRAALLTLVVGTGACADAASPFEPVAAEASVVVGGRLTGTYEATGPVTLAGGAVVYRVGVYFGTEQDTPGATYLVQVGVRQAGQARLTLHQDSYVVSGDAVEFRGGVLSGAVLRGDVLEATVDAAGERVAVRLERVGG